MALVYLEPEPLYSTTSVAQTFPEAHWPLENTRHKIGQAVHGFVHPYEHDIRTPHADIRETARNYYIDVELPGLADKKDLSLQWTSSKTLLVEAKIQRPEIEEEGLPLQRTDSPTGSPSNKKPPKGDPVHLLARERRVGDFARAFHFNVNVDHEKLNATLKNGLLRIVIEKPETEHNGAKEVYVKHEDEQTKV